MRDHIQELVAKIPREKFECIGGMDDFHTRWHAKWWTSLPR